MQNVNFYSWPSGNTSRRGSCCSDLPTWVQGTGCFLMAADRALWRSVRVRAWPRQVCYMAVGAQLRPISGSEQSPYSDGDIPAFSDWTSPFDCLFGRCVDVMC